MWCVHGYHRGGINPAIVTKNADVHLAAKRIAWGRVFNAGQVSPAGFRLQNHACFHITRWNPL